MSTRRSNIEGLTPAGLVLVVDDDRDFADSVADLLAIHGYIVGVETHPGAALGSVRQFRAGVALVDLHLGDASADTLARRIREELGTS